MRIYKDTVACDCGASFFSEYKKAARVSLASGRTVLEWICEMCGQTYREHAKDPIYFDRNTHENDFKQIEKQTAGSPGK